MVLSRRADGAPLAVSVDAPAPLGELPAAVEVAAYRIVTEALTNVTRHSNADSAVVTLAVDGGELRVAVHDDGVNVGGGWQPGVGLTSIRERAAELGGRCTIQLDRTGGRVDVAAAPGRSWPRTAGRMARAASDAADRGRRRPHRGAGGHARAAVRVDGYELVGDAGTGDEAVRAAVTLRPDVVVMDIQMPGMTGIEATREIARVAPEVAVLMLTMFEDDESVFAAMRAGALGYVLKGARAGRHDPGHHVGRRGRGDLRHRSGPARADLPDRGRAPTSAAFPELTAREREVLDLIAAGITNAAIAAPAGARPATRSATTSPTSSPSCGWRAAPRRSSAPAAGPRRLSTLAYPAVLGWTAGPGVPAAKVAPLTRPCTLSIGCERA